MSEPLRIAAAVEGPTGVIVLEAVLKALAWPKVSARLTEAARFESEFLTARAVAVGRIRGRGP